MELPVELRDHWWDLVAELVEVDDMEIRRSIQREDNNTEYIKLKKVGQDSNKIHFQVKQTTEMEKLHQEGRRPCHQPLFPVRRLQDQR